MIRFLGVTGAESDPIKYLKYLMNIKTGLLPK